MSRYFIELTYKGTPFCGWQLQPNGPTVQEELEQAFGKLLREPVRLTGAGRTDAGVHALRYVAHFDASRDDLHTDALLINKINGIIPREIAVYRIAAVPPDAHARFDAVSRTYHYRIATKKNPFTVDLAYHLYRPLNMAKMNEAAAIFPEYKDFTSFSKLHGNAKTNLCDILAAYWTDDGNGELRFVVTANRFLRNMVRAMVGTMIEIGLGKYPPADIRRIILEKNRGAAGTSAPPQGLYLAKIEYPEIPGYSSADVELLKPLMFPAPD
ncbi:MAG: tRNA pseudouridine(38-40) synthase TruA [Bacteroidales bacterium]|nr:tRNA pseudouridine(38-40) synthase TruA [Bacteroidales bacterium]